MLKSFKIDDSAISYITVIGFLFGVFCYSFISFGMFVPLLLLSISFVLIALFVKRTIKVRALLISIALASIAFGCLRVLVVPDVYTDVAEFHKQKVELQGTVAKDPEKREKTTHLVIDIETIDGQKREGRVLVIAERLIEASYKDHVFAEGQLQIPSSFETDTGKEFDYASYLEAKGIGATMIRPNVVIEVTDEHTVLGSLYALKASFERSIERIMPEPAAGLLEGILLGNRDALGEKWYELFVMAGLVHIVVLSGYNLSIIADNMFRVLTPLSKQLAYALGALFIVLFVLMVGAEATVVRAMIMALVVIVGRVLQRPHALLRALSFACAVMVLHNPLILTADPSFILSFLATFGLITLGSSFEKTFSFLPDIRGLRGIAAATLSTQVFVLPALVFYTGSLSLVSLPANLLALPLIPASMFFGFIAGLVGLLSTPLGTIAMVPAWALLSLVLWITQIASSIPYAAVSVAGLQTPLIFVLYVLLVPLALLVYQRSSQLRDNP